MKKKDPDMYLLSQKSNTYISKIKKKLEKEKQLNSVKVL